MASAAILPNKRLSEGSRNDLYRLAVKRVAETQDSAALDDAYDKAATVIQKAMLALYPAKDMAVLQRYQTATADKCIYFSTGGGDYQQFCFRDADKRIPLRPRDRGCNSRTPILLEGENEAALKAYNVAAEDHKSNLKSRGDDFKALIFGAKTFNEVASVWPGAEALREAICGQQTALSVLSSDVIDRLRADQALAA